MVSSPGRHSTAKCFQSAMQIDLERALGAAGQRRGVGERALVQHETLHRLALARRQACERMSEGTCGLGLSEPSRWIGRFIGMVFKRERCVHLAHVLPAHTAQEIDCPTIGDDGQPRGERSAGVIGLPRTMNGQQRVLHHIVDMIGRYTAPPRDSS